MDGHSLEVIGVALLLVFAGTMFYQGTLILHQQRGYSQKDVRGDLARMRRRVEEMMKEDEP
jgi:hypothetical protein